MGIAQAHAPNRPVSLRSAGHKRCQGNEARSEGDIEMTERAAVITRIREIRTAMENSGDKHLVNICEQLTDTQFERFIVLAENVMDAEKP